jgi:hypothetical protein
MALCTAGAPLSAQSGPSLVPGEVVRVDRDFVGTLMSIDEATLVIIGEGEPTCWPGIGHGEGPRCDPAPSVRRVVDWRGTTVERQLSGQGHTLRTLAGFAIGAVAFAPVGYLTGPSLGYGKVDGCARGATGPVGYCGNPIDADVLARTQRTRDQRRGALFLGVLGGTMGAFVARRLANDWLEVRPPATLASDEPWTVGLRVPAGGR